MSKYAKLSDHLNALKCSEWSTNFSEIEKILGFALPRSARNYREWWSNNYQNGRNWINFGWKTEDVNISREFVTFKKTYTGIGKKRKNTKPENVPSYYSWDTNSEDDFSASVKWKTLGKVTMDKGGKLLLPKTESIPAIYRFRVKCTNGKEKIYIGETENLSRRFSGYRNPGNTKVTNARINKTLLEEIAAGAEVSASSSAAASYTIGRKTIKANLELKAARCIFENFEIIKHKLAGIKILNSFKKTDIEEI